jgi:UDP-N-acetyl-D-glucosamine dehydrogenase
MTSKIGGIKVETSKTSSENARPRVRETPCPNMWCIGLPMALNSQRKAFNGSKVLVPGLAYKPNLDDECESPSYVLMNLLSEGGAEIEYHDPYVRVVKPTREHSHWAGKESMVWDKRTVQSFGPVLIATNHACVDYKELAGWASLIVDTRIAMAGIPVAPGTVRKA